MALTFAYPVAPSDHSFESAQAVNMNGSITPSHGRMCLPRRLLRRSRITKRRRAALEMNCVIAGMTSSWTSNFITRPMRRQFSQSSRSAPDLNGESLPPQTPRSRRGPRRRCCSTEMSRSARTTRLCPTAARLAPDQRAKADRLHYVVLKFRLAYFSVFLTAPTKIEVTFKKGG